MSEDGRYRVLAVITDAGHRQLLEVSLQRSQWELEFVSSIREVMRRMEEDAAPVVICDVECGDWRVLVGEGPLPLVVVTSRLADEQLWQEVLSAGGYDVLPVPFDKRDLFRVLSVAGSHWRHRQWLTAAMA
jgi:DNA-binding NtrC family response regulator